MALRSCKKEQDKTCMFLVLMHSRDLKRESPAPTDPPRDGHEEAQKADGRQQCDLNTKYFISRFISIAV
jgi:hypothetical protein